MVDGASCVFQSLLRTPPRNLWIFLSSSMNSRSMFCLSSLKELIMCNAWSNKEITCACCVVVLLCVSWAVNNVTDVETSRLCRCPSLNTCGCWKSEEIREPRLGSLVKGRRCLCFVSQRTILKLLQRLMS
jgi:hypothetical protein